MEKENSVRAEEAFLLFPNPPCTALPKGLGRYRLGNLKTAAKAASQGEAQQEAHVGEVLEHLDVHSHGGQLGEGGPCPS